MPLLPISTRWGISLIANTGTTPPPTADPAPPTGNRRDLRRDEPEPTPAADSVVAEPASEPAATTEEPAPVENLHPGTHPPGRAVRSRSGPLCRPDFQASRPHRVLQPLR